MFQAFEKHMDDEMNFCNPNQTGSLPPQERKYKVYNVFILVVCTFIFVCIE